MRVVRGGVLVAIPGYLLGILLAVALGHVFKAVFVGVRPLDPSAYIPVTLVILGAILAASIFPARRASALHPMEALRHD
jgi:ABC-type antimicrobial peptide transport system permease subunit